MYGRAIRVTVWVVNVVANMATNTVENAAVTKSALMSQAWL
jgi:hypothetical protein